MKIERLGLSSAAAPDASLDELLAACARRGLRTLELRAGDWHGVDLAADPENIAAARERLATADIELCAYVADAGGNDLRLGRLSVALDVPLLVPPGAHVLDRCIALAGVGARAVPLLTGMEDDATLGLAHGAGVDVAFDADASIGELHRRAERLRSRFGDRLIHVRLSGGEPEAVMHDGHGIGDLLSRLALDGFDGSLVIAPGSSSSASSLAPWRAWLGLPPREDQLPAASASIQAGTTGSPA